MLPGVIAQRLSALVAAQLDVVGRDAHVLKAQVFSEDAADLTIADEADIPLPGIGCGRGHVCLPFMAGNLVIARSVSDDAIQSLWKERLDRFAFARDDV